MSESSIQWVATRGPDGTWHQGFTMNPWIGCQRVSAECDHCYADAGSKRLAAQHKLTLWDEGSSRYFTGEDYWKQPAKWNRKADKLGVRLKVFCASYSDVFEDRPELVDRRARLMRLIEGTPHLDWLLLTKRPENMVKLASPVWSANMWPSNVWAGTTVGVKPSLVRLEHLRKVPAAIRFVSMEPLLEWTDPSFLDETGPAAIHWCIVGGESGAKARPIDVDWVRKLVAQCRTAGVSPFVKQMGRRILGDDRGFRVNHWLLDGGGEWVAPWLGARASVRPSNAVGFSLHDSHGGDWDEWPSDLRVREYPTPRE